MERRSKCEGCVITYHSTYRHHRQRQLVKFLVEGQNACSIQILTVITERSVNHLFGKMEISDTQGAETKDERKMETTDAEGEPVVVRLELCAILPEGYISMCFRDQS